MRDARKHIPWVPDDELYEVDHRPPIATAASSILVPGAGDIINHRPLRGGAVVAGAVAAVALGLSLGLGGWVFALTAISGAALTPKTWRDAKAINTFVATREAHRLNRANTSTADALRLLRATDSDAPSAVAAAPVQQPAEELPLDESTRRVITKLRQGFKLHRSGMLNADEFRERKVEIFSASGVIEREGMDALMEAMLPLFEEGVVDDEDLALLKALADVPLELTEF